MHLIEVRHFLRYWLPVRYCFHCHESGKLGIKPLEYQEWKRLIMGTEYPGGVGQPYTAWRAFTNYTDWWQFRWDIFHAWFWQAMLTAWKNRREILMYIRSYR